MFVDRSHHQGSDNTTLPSLSSLSNPSQSTTITDPTVSTASDRYSVSSLALLPNIFFELVINTSITFSLAIGAYNKLRRSNWCLQQIEKMRLVFTRFQSDISKQTELSLPLASSMSVRTNIADEPIFCFLCFFVFVH